jgi:hypothetical protein
MLQIVGWWSQVTRNVKIFDYALDEIGNAYKILVGTERRDTSET